MCAINRSVAIGEMCDVKTWP